jgi:membrane protease YdiL (CAAX protease family)
LTVVEESLFRGIVQEQLWTALPSHALGQILAVVISSLLFASLHFVRPQKRMLLPGLGLFALGVLLSVAYLRSGHHYILPIAIHAGGVWFIQATRPLVEYRGPSWLIGYSSYPICGGMGLIVMALMGLIVLTTVGV